MNTARLRLPILLFAFALLCRQASAQSWYPSQFSTTGDWNTPSYWAPGTVPTASGFVSASNNNTTNITGSAVASALYVGEYNFGILNINATGSLATSNSIIGSNSTGTVNINGGAWTNATSLWIGYTNGKGILNINSGSLTSNDVILGFNTPGANVSTTTVSGGTLTVNSAFQVSGNSPGSLLINGGTVNSNFSTVGTQSTGTATVSSGNWNIADTSLYVGRFYGTGTLTLANTGVVKVANGAGTLVLGFANTSLNNKLQIGNNTAFTGSLQVAAVNGGAGTGSVVFNQTNAYTFAPNLTGTLSVQQAGTGTTTLTGSNTYTGGMTVVSGKLMAMTNAATGSGAVTVKTGGALGGTGSITGLLTVESGGTLAPGSSTFAANGGINLQDGSKFSLQLGTTSELITDNGALSLGKNITLALSPAVGFAEGQYSLINFTGALTDSSNNFSGWNVTGLANGYGAEFVLSGSSVKLNVFTVPEPVAGTTFALGLTICVMTWRRRFSS